MGILNDSFEVGGTKIPVIAVVIGGAVIILILVVGKGSGGTTTPDKTGLLAEELNQRLQEQTASTEAALANITSQLETQLQMEGATTRAAVTGQQGQLLNFGDLLQRIQEQIAALLAGRTESSPPAPPTSPLPSGSEIQSWASGIGLPVEWGQAFVTAFGHLPQNLAELNTWMGQVATHPGGQTCIAGRCI
jgi:hypothetical protein